MDKGRYEVGGRGVEIKRLGVQGDGEVSVVGGGFRFHGKNGKSAVCVTVHVCVYRSNPHLSFSCWKMQPSLIFN